MTNSESNNCLICDMKDLRKQSEPGRHSFQRCRCENCGEYIWREILGPATLADMVRGKREKAILSHAIKKSQSELNPVELDKEWIKNALGLGLPTPSEQGENLILWLGKLLDQEGHGQYKNIDNLKHRAVLGAAGPEGVAFVVDSLLKARYLEEQGTPAHRYRLTFEGWAHFEQIKRVRSSSNEVFIAMQFGDETLEKVFEAYRIAVDATGFILVRLDKRPKAGLLDNRIIVEIRKARLVIADLTHGNQGAYWEAGFAYGLDKPVIYSCAKDEFKNVHFDTSHYQAIIWDAKDLEKATEDLKASIRATLPTEARMYDD